MTQPELSTDLQKALAENHGVVEGQSFILMTTDFYRELFGLRSDEALQQSLSAIEEGLEDVEAGRIHDMDTVFCELDERYDIQH